MFNRCLIALVTFTLAPAGDRLHRGNDEPFGSDVVDEKRHPGAKRFKRRHGGREALLCGRKLSESPIGRPSERTQEEPLPSVGHQKSGPLTKTEHDSPGETAGTLHSGSNAPGGKTHSAFHFNLSLNSSDIALA
jgi:hypothetical protein